nr:MAG TPA: hypothetical protein [Caudoviricetes sp.]
MNKMNNILFLLFITSGVTISLLVSRNAYLSKEKERFRINTDALLSDIQHIQIDSAMMASTVKVLQLSLDEYKRYKAEDAATIKKMGVKIKDLETTGRHDIEINAPIDTEVKDSIVYKDTVAVFIRNVKMDTPYIKLDGVIEDNHLTGRIRLPVHLHQAIWIEYKHRLLWWRWKVKAIHQTMASDNPYAEIKYSEFINIKN